MNLDIYLFVVNCCSPQLVEMTFYIFVWCYYINTVKKKKIEQKTKQKKCRKTKNEKLFKAIYFQNKIQRREKKSTHSYMQSAKIDTVTDPGYDNIITTWSFLVLPATR